MLSALTRNAVFVSRPRSDRPNLGFHQARLRYASDRARKLRELLRRILYVMLTGKLPPPRRPGTTSNRFVPFSMTESPRPIRAGAQFEEVQAAREAGERARECRAGISGPGNSFGCCLSSYPVETSACATEQFY